MGVLDPIRSTNSNASMQPEANGEACFWWEARFKSLHFSKSQQADGFWNELLKSKLLPQLPPIDACACTMELTSWAEAGSHALAQTGPEWITVCESEYISSSDVRLSLTGSQPKLLVISISIIGCPSPCWWVQVYLSVNFQEKLELELPVFLSKAFCYISF